MHRSASCAAYLRCRLILLYQLLLVTSLCGQSEGQEPAPIPVPVSNSWLGYDGTWSPIIIQVGSNSQPISLLPNTNSEETWVIGPGGCDATFTCQQERGGTFFLGQSSTWTNLGDYDLNFDADLGVTGYADYGLDQISLSGDVSLDGQIIGVMNSTEFWLGQFGLGVKGTTFGQSTQLTFLSALVENASLAPSHSYGYTAGAYYQLKNVPASLTLGGVDTNRFRPNTATFALGSQLQPILAINEISVRAYPFQSSNAPQWASNPVTLLDSSRADVYTIDSSTPFLWLPEDVCDKFADTFGLAYNESLNLYLFNESISSPDILTNWNMIFTFSISDYPGSLSNRVDLTLPYGAFNLQLTYPFPNLEANFTSPPTNYFPLRRAASKEQLTIGRAFLQETYLTVDYERNNFSISQAKFSVDALTNVNLVPITRPPNSNWTGPTVHESTAGVGSGVKAGAVVAVVAVAALFAALCYYLLVIRKRKAQQHAQDKVEKEGKGESLSELAGESRPFNELPASKIFPHEADSDTARFELVGSLPLEMPAEEVPATFLSSPRQPNNTGQFARWPSTQKRMMPSLDETISTPTLPPYSPTNGSISPNSLRHSAGRLGSHTTSSGDQQISPMDNRSAGHSRLPSQEHNSSSSVSPFSTMSPATRTRMSFSPRPRPDATHAEDEGVELDENMPPVRSPDRSTRFSWE